MAAQLYSFLLWYLAIGAALASFALAVLVAGGYREGRWGRTTVDLTVEGDQALAPTVRAALHHPVGLLLVWTWLTLTWPVSIRSTLRVRWRPRRRTTA